MSRKFSTVTKSVFLVAIAQVLLGSIAKADTLSFVFSDPVSDHSGLVDVVEMAMQFDNLTGDYQIQLSAEDANPFQGDFRININLFNPDTGTTAPFSSFFDDVFNDFNLQLPVTTIMLEGSQSSLTFWESGDRVSTSMGPFGNPSNLVNFFSGVHNLDDFSQNDLIAFNEFTTIVPEPSTLGLLAAC